MFILFASALFINSFVLSPSPSRTLFSAAPSGCVIYESSARSERNVCTLRAEEKNFLSGCAVFCVRISLTIRGEDTSGKESSRSNGNDRVAFADCSNTSRTSRGKPTTRKPKRKRKKEIERRKGTRRAIHSQCISHSTLNDFILKSF